MADIFRHLTVPMIPRMQRPGLALALACRCVQPVTWQSHTDGGDNGATEEESAGQVPTGAECGITAGVNSNTDSLCHLLYRDNGVQGNKV